MFRLGAVGICLWLVAASLYAQVDASLKKAAYRIRDRGESRVFEVAHDEIYIGAATGSQHRRIVKIPAAASPEGARLRADQVARTEGTPADLVLYEAGKPRDDAARRFLTRHILVRMQRGADPQRIATETGLRFRGAALPGSDLMVFEATEPGGALERAEALRNGGAVISAEPQLARQQQKRFAPDDPYFDQQWHLQNTGQSGSLTGTDVNIAATWDSFRGAGIRIGIVDDGLQLTHPDLAANVDTDNDRDWNDSTPNDPSPTLTKDYHGTACAGAAAAKGDNSIGVSGAAPDATLVGLRLISAPTVDQQEAEAMLWRNDLIAIKSNSWGPSDNGRTLEGPGPLTKQAFADAVATGRGGLGTIFVWAGGNGAVDGDNSNYDGYANAPETIAVGAVTNLGKRASFSEPGANLVVSAPSSGGTLRIVTTDLMGSSGYNGAVTSGELSDRDYTNGFGGTSAATPIVAGCVALMLEANPNLGWRDVQEILMRSAKKVDPTNSDWIINTAGFHFNHNFGAGLVDATAAVALARIWQNLPQRTSLVATRSGLNTTIPDNNPNGTNLTFDLSTANLRAEHVTVRLSITHTSRGQLAITLTSPTGVQSRLAERRTDTGDHYSDWTFSTVRNWGEDSQGVWTLNVADLVSGTTGRITSATVTVYGTPAGSLNRPPSITSVALSRGPSLYEDQTLEVTTIDAVDPDGDPISFAYQWQESSDNITFQSIPGANFRSLQPFGMSGRIVRCVVTPIAAGKMGSDFISSSVSINRAPPTFASHGQLYSYDTDLFLRTPGANATRALIINEFSQGSGSIREWIELLVLHQSDLRGFTLADKLGKYVTFSTAEMWSAVPAGTLIVIYNGNERDSALPSDRIDLANKLIIIPHTNTTAFSTRAWAGINNTGAESIVVRNATGELVDGISINNDLVYTPSLANVSGQRSAAYQADTDFGAESSANWRIASYLSATPAVGNSTANSQLISNLRTGTPAGVPKYRFAASSDLVPGLFLDEATGILYGIPDVSEGGLFRIVLERLFGTETVSQSFNLLVAGMDGRAIIPANETWRLDSDAVLPVDLEIHGRLETNDRTLTVAGTLLVAANATVDNSGGLISFGNHQGKPLPGKYTLAPDPVNDIADPDGDSLPNLVEFALGTDPTRPSSLLPLEADMTSGSPQYTVRYPSGAVGVTRVIEVSTDLVTWHTGAPHTEVVSETIEAEGTRSITIRHITEGQASFGRLRISR